MERARINLQWLVRLRWFAILGQAAVIALVVGVLRLSLPLGWLMALLLAELTSNALAAFRARRGDGITDHHVGALVAVDLVLFTIVLGLTGGPENPFSFLYLVPIALAAHMLPPGWTWSLVALTMVCSGLLFLLHVPLPGSGAHMHHMQRHLQGMWLALALAAAFIVYFLDRVTKSLRARDAELARAKERTLRAHRIASLATLATGAAHELATPLGTIAVACGELGRRIDPKDSAIAEDVALIRSEVKRCRDILDRMSEQAGTPVGEAPEPLSATALIDELLEGLAQRERVQVRVDDSALNQTCTVPRHAFLLALRSVLENALEASSAAVELAVRHDSGGWTWTVVDDGPGMDDAVRGVATQPFFTTKESGLGLGLFLAESVAEQLDGQLELSAATPRGTRAELTLPNRK